MYSTLLSPSFIIRLTTAQDLESLVRMLAESPYGPYLTGFEEQALSPRRLIYQVKLRLSGSYLAIIDTVPPAASAIIKQLYWHFEVDNLKAVLRGIVSHSSWEHIQEVLFPINPASVIPAQEMLETPNVESAVERISHTAHFATISLALERYKMEQSLFPLEVSLDLSYWRNLWEDVNHLKGQDRTKALRLIGSLVDMNNLMWAIRYRVYHHLTEEEVINYTLPFGYRVKDEDIRAIAAGVEIAPLVTRLFPDMKKVEELLQEPQTGLPLLELQLKQYIAKECQAAFVGYPFHIGVPLAYLILNELEIQDLTVLFEAKSSSMPTEDFLPYLLLANKTQEEVQV